MLEVHPNPQAPEDPLTLGLQTTSMGPWISSSSFHTKSNSSYTDLTQASGMHETEAIIHEHL
jgi:hypothetical protein